MTTDETKYESARVCLIYLAFIVAIMTSPWWAPMLDGAMEATPIVVMECAK